ITKDQLLIQMKEEDFESVIDVNLKGCFHMSKACIRPFIKQRNGRIINISSVVGMMGNAGQVNYAASKAGIIGLTKSIAKEYAAKGVTCNAVAPGYIQTEMTQVLSEQASDGIMSQIPTKRFGNPEDVANVVSFLAQDAASYITGEVIKVDGGMYI
ncbi:MAG TPA: SDR family oxidoreductase, partial [Lachnospiraceae bacterium]|nr:SDR family oxidoreductase [Lachnospiraceae bacterium]